MDPNYSLELRIAAAQLYRDLVSETLGYTVPHVGTAEGLIALAQKIDAGPLEGTYGWRTEPPFPGAGEKPEEMPKGWRMICASKFFVGDEEVGVTFMMFVGGRPVVVVINPPGFPIPKEYSPIHVR